MGFSMSEEGIPYVIIEMRYAFVLYIDHKKDKRDILGKRDSL